VGFTFGPAYEFPSVASIREDMLNEREPRAGAFQDTFGAVAVLNVGGMDLDRKQATVRVGQDVALAPGDLLPGVIAFKSPF
jgi:hypothetical protein